MSILDLRLNMHVVAVPCHDSERLAELFDARAHQVRAGVRGSPRGLKSPVLAEYKGFFVLELCDNFQIVAEQTSEDSGLPLNEFAYKHLGCSLYGPVFLMRRVHDQFIPILPSMFQEKTVAALRATADSALTAHIIMSEIRNHI